MILKSVQSFPLFLFLPFTFLLLLSNAKQNVNACTVWETTCHTSESFILYSKWLFIFQLWWDKCRQDLWLALAPQWISLSEVKTLSVTSHQTVFCYSQGWADSFDYFIKEINLQIMKDICDIWKIKIYVNNNINHT